MEWKYKRKKEPKEQGDGDKRNAQTIDQNKEFKGSLK